MILHLLLAALALGLEFWGNLAENQTCSPDLASHRNLTAAANRTFSVPVASSGGAAKSQNGSSLFNLTAMSETERRGNLTTEDNENFQEQQDLLPPSGCHRGFMVDLFEGQCGHYFHQAMSGIRDPCIMEDVLRPYNTLSLCLEHAAQLSGCFYPNPDSQDFLLKIHSGFFSRCSQEVEDAPDGLVLVLTLAPMAAFLVLVYLAVWKSKARE